MDNTYRKAIYGDRNQYTRTDVRKPEIYKHENIFRNTDY